MRTAVVLPAPLGPSRPSTVPGEMARSIPSRALTSPNALRRSSTSTAGWSGIVARGRGLDEIVALLRSPPVTVEVRPVRSLLGRRTFVDLPFRLFRHDPAWVPPLRFSVYDRISPRYPANDHQETALWMAYRNGKPVARIGVCVDRLFNQFQDLAWAWVGFFESFDDQEAASALFDRACRWAADRGMSECVGPASFTTNDECGLLVEGFEHPPMILTPQNPP